MESHFGEQVLGTQIRQTETRCASDTERCVKRCLQAFDQAAHERGLFHVFGAHTEFAQAHFDQRVLSAEREGHVAML